MHGFSHIFNKLVTMLLIGGAIWYWYDFTNESDSDRMAARPYVRHILTVDAAQVEQLILSGKRNSRPTLIYIFDSKCLLCRWHFEDMVNFSRIYPSHMLNILLLSLDQDMLDLAAFLRREGYPKVKTLKLKNGADNALLGVMNRLGATAYDGDLPYIGVANKAGHIDSVLFGWDRNNKIRGLIDRALATKQ